MSGLGPVTVGNPTGNFGFGVAAGQCEFKVGGWTIDWSNANIPVNTTAANLTLADGTIVAAGQKYISFGQIMIVTLSSNKQIAAVPAVAATSMVIGRTFIANKTVLQGDYLDVHAGEPIESGRVFLRRIQAAVVWGIAGPSTVTGPTAAAIQTAMPGIKYIDD